VSETQSHREVREVKAKGQARLKKLDWGIYEKRGRS